MPDEWPQETRISGPRFKVADIPLFPAVGKAAYIFYNGYMPKQVIFIHGGETFATYKEYLAFLRSFPMDLERLKPRQRWRDWLIGQLGADFEGILPQMPNGWNARYEEWKIYFEKMIPLLNDEVMLVGHSLGGIFLAKYLAEHDFPKRIIALFLLAAPYDDSDSGYALNDFALPESLERITVPTYVYHSENDDVVPFADAAKYMRALPNATLRTFPAYGHFSLPEFPELLDDIKAVWP